MYGLVKVNMQEGATTFSIMTLSIMALSRMGLMATLSINDTRRKNWMSLCWGSRFIIVMLNVIMLSVIRLSVIMLSVLLFLLLCWMSLCWVSLCWVSCFTYCFAEWHYANVALCWASLCWVSLYWLSRRRAADSGQCHKSFQACNLNIYTIS
jgi:hypothetical protein